MYLIAIGIAILNFKERSQIMFRFSFGYFLALIIPVLTMSLMVLGIFALILVIKALQIYIKNNGNL